MLLMAVPASLTEAAAVPMPGKADSILAWLADHLQPDRARALEILDSPASKDGVTVTLEKAEAKRSDNGGFVYLLQGTIENTSDEGIMKVVYTFSLRDQSGEEYRSFGEVYDGEVTAIPPHSRIEFSHDDVRWGPQSVPASVAIGISSVQTETELPPAHIPMPVRRLMTGSLRRLRKNPRLNSVFTLIRVGTEGLQYLKRETGLIRQ